MTSPHVNGRDPRYARILAVVDWTVDPRAVAAALRAESERAPVEFGLLVPARLPGLDWIGDPYASRPCADRQLAELRRLAEELGLPVGDAAVGDPECVAAVRASLEDLPADRVVIFDRRRLLPGHPLSVVRRVARRTGRPVELVTVAPAAPAGRHVRWTPRCAPVGA